MTRDPVCGMEVDKHRVLNLVLAGRCYYFCSQSCLEAFAGARGIAMTGSRLIRRPASLIERLTANRLVLEISILTVLCLAWLLV
jgi:YHS domain-containing protein